MAGDWIKMRSNLWDDPRVASLVDATDTSEAAVVGALYWLWATADQHTKDGVMPGLTLRQVDRKTGIQGFGAALCAIGWLSDDAEGVRLINFTEHNGASAKLRATDAKKKAVARSGAKSEGQIKKLTPAQKNRIFALDGFKCVYCGRHKDDPVPPNLDPSSYVLSVDHLIPISRGGDNSDDNLVTACLPCNMAKNDRTQEEYGVVPNLSERTRTNHGKNSPIQGAREEKRREEKKEQDQNLSSSAGADDLHAKREQRLKAIALEAIAAYNATLARPHGTLAAVRSTVGLDTRIANVRRCVKVASDICQATYGSQTITPEFWTHYFAAVKADPFKSGEQGGGQGHENWKPDFEYLTRPKTMLQVYDRAESEAA